MKEKELLLLRLVENMFEKQQTFLLLDELYEDEIIGTYIRNIQIDSPYQQLLFEGVLSQFSWGEELVVSLTVENYFHHLLALVLQKDQRFSTPESLIQLVESNKLKGLKEGVSNLLSFDVELGDFNRITQLIDLSEGDEAILVICVMPLVNALLIHGVGKTVGVVLENPTDNDWKVLNKLNDIINNLQLHILRKDFLKELISYNQLQTKDEILLGLKAILLFDKEESKVYLSKIDTSDKFIQEDKDLLFQLGIIKEKLGYFDRALKFFEKSIDIELKNIGEENSYVASLYCQIGLVLCSKGNFEKSLKFYKKSLEIRFRISNKENLEVANLYNNIGSTWLGKRNLDQAIIFFQKSLDLYLKILGFNHSFTATVYGKIGYIMDAKGDLDNAINLHNKSLEIILRTHGKGHLWVGTVYSNLGLVWDSKGEYDKALNLHYKSLEITIKNLGKNHHYVSYDYNNIGLAFKSKCNYKKALHFFKKSLVIRLNALGNNHPLLVTSYTNIGDTLLNLTKYNDALIHFKNAFQILKKGSFPFKIAQCYEALNEKENALDYYIQSAEIRKDDPEVGLTAESTQESISNSKRLAKELGKERDLQEWMK